MVRRNSEAGRLTSESEIHNLLRANHSGHPQEKEFEGALERAQGENEDLTALRAEDGSRYFYSLLFMTGAYATLLLNRRDPMRLIADIVRQNSADYPRPVPLDFFLQPPFDYKIEDFLSYLEQLGTEEEFNDIARTTTSTSRVFLYSTLYLEPEHAFLLAQSLDVGYRDFP